jgi:hypothetical protein
MPVLQVDSLQFTFTPGIAAERYDTWQHYTTVLSRGGKKAVDVVAVENPVAPATTWLIESKDFRVITNPPKPSNIAGLAQQVADKTADTLAGLLHTSAHATAASERSHSNIAISAPVKRVVLHLEPHVGAHSVLFPAGFAASVLQSLRQLVRSVDANPLVLNIANTAAAGVPWGVV